MATVQETSKLSRSLGYQSKGQESHELIIGPGRKAAQRENKFQKSRFANTTKAKLSSRSLEGGTDALPWPLVGDTDALASEESKNGSREDMVNKSKLKSRDVYMVTDKSLSNLSAKSLDGQRVRKISSKTGKECNDKVVVQNLRKLDLGLDNKSDDHETDTSEEDESGSKATSSRSQNSGKEVSTRLSSHKSDRSQMAGTDIDPKPSKVYYCWECFDPTLDPSSVGFCVECNDYLCLTCVNIHGGRLKTRKHTIFAGRDMEQILNSEGYTTDSSDSEPEKPEFFKEPKLIRECMIMAPEDKEKCTIHSATVLADGSVILCDIMNNNLKHFDVKFRLKSVLDLGSGPRDICTSNIKESEVYVTLNSFHAFFKIATKPKLEIIKSTEVGGECYGITCWKQGVAVTAAVKKFAEGTLELFLLDYEGHTLRRVQQNIYDKYEMYFDDYKGKNERKRHHEIGKMQLDMPWNLSSDNKGQRIIVSDYGNHTVTCINVDGKVEYQFEDANLNGPTSIAMDDEENMFILGQRSHNVYQMTRKREKLGQILTREDGLEYPGAIIYNPVNKTFILQVRGWSDKIQVYKLD